MVIWGRAPLRISFCGGGTDVSPYVEERGGIVLSAAIDLCASAHLCPRSRPGITVRSRDYGIVATLSDRDAKAQAPGCVELVRSVLRHFLSGFEADGLPPGEPASRWEEGLGLELVLESDAPPGSGLGSSSALIVALIGAVGEWRGTALTAEQTARLAYRIERHELGIPGGMQDQYAAAFGGINVIEFGRDAVTVSPLPLDDRALAALHARLLLCYTGRTRVSANIIRTQVDAYRRREAAAVDAMEELKRLTLAMKGALMAGRLEQFGGLLHEAWMHKKRLARQISDEGIDRLYETGREAGALGGKLLGAGGGGYLLFYCEPQLRRRVSEALSREGGQSVEFDFDRRGLRVGACGAVQPATCSVQRAALRQQNVARCTLHAERSEEQKDDESPGDRRRGLYRVPPV